MRVSVLAAAMGAGVLPAMAVAILAPYLVRDLGLTSGEFGLLQGAFFLAAALASPRMGSVVDGIGSVPAVGLVFVCATVSLVGTSVSHHVAWLLLFMSVAGAANAAAPPATNLQVLHIAVQGTQGALIGVKQTGVPLVGLLVAVTLPSLASLYGWRTAMLCAAATTALVGVGTATLRQPPRTAAPTGDRRPRRVLGDSGAGRRLRPYAFLMGGATAASQGFLVLYATETLGQSPRVAGLLAALMTLVGVASRVAWCRDDGWDPSKKLALISALTAVGSLVLLLAAWGGSGPAVLAACILGMSVQVWNSVVMLAVIGIVPAERLGRASGVVARPFFAGMLVMSPALGLLADASGTFVWTWPVAAALACAAALTISVRIGTNSGAPRQSSRRAFRATTDGRLAAHGPALRRRTPLSRSARTRG